MIAIAIVALGAVVVGWQNLPRLWDADARLAGFALGAAILLSWWMGRRSGRRGAVAVATAHAEARAAAQAQAGAQANSQVVINIGDPNQPRAGAEHAGLDNLPWIGEQKPMLEQDGSEDLELDVDAAQERQEAYISEG